MDMDLVALEEIRQVKYRYLRCVDLKLWDEMADVFTAEATADYGTHAVRGSLSLRGRDAILAYLRENLGPSIITVHRCGHGLPGRDQGRGVLRRHLPARRGRPLADLAHRLHAHLRDHLLAGRHPVAQVPRQ